jgi:hypothetical protein
MPQFTDYANMDIDVDDFLQECTSAELEEVIEWLRDEEYITKFNLLDDFDGEPKSALQQLFEKDLIKIQNSYLQISKEDFEAINRIAKKY